MVQLSPSPVLDDASPPPELSEQGKKMQSSPKMGSPSGLSAFQLALDDASSASTTYPGYDGYIEDGLICLKHKVRNLEKKKLKLEDYTKRLNRGEALNKDQMGAVEKYDEVIHNLAFAQDLHKTLTELTQNLLRDQKKAVKKEHEAKMELERRRLGSVLQIQHLLHCLQEEHIRRDLLAGENQAPHIPAPQLHSLTQLAALLGVKRDNNLSLQEQMEQSALAYLDLLEGKDKPVAGSTFKLMKQELDRLLDCKYFRSLPPPPSKTTEVFLSSPSLTNISKPKDISKKEFLNRLYLRDTETTPPQNWKEEFEAIKDREPPDSWELEFADGSDSQFYGRKTWRGAATFVPKIPVAIKKHDGKQRSTKKAKGEHNAKTTMHIGTPVEVFKSPSALPKDPVQRKRQLEDLMTKIRTGSFSFMQESLLDGDGSPTNGHPRPDRRPSGSPSPKAQRESMRSPVDILPTAMRSPVDILPTSMRSPVDILPTSMRSPVDILPTSMRSPVDILPTSMRSPVDILPTSMRSPVDILPTSMRSPVDILPTSMRSEVDILPTSLRSPVDIIPTAMHSTPRATSLVDQNANLTNGEPSPVTCDLDLDLTTDELPDEALQLPDAEPAFSTPPLYRRESTISVSLEEKSRPRTPVSESGKQSPCNGVVPCSTPPQNQGFSTPPTRRSLTSTPFQNIHSVFKVNAPLPPNGDLSYKVDSGVFSETRFSTASTQTPPEFVLPEDQPETVYQSDYTVGNGVQLFLSPGQSGGGAGRTGQAYYTRGAVRGMARGGGGGGKGLAHTFRTPGGAFIHQAHLRDSGPLLYGARDPGYQHGYRRGGGSGGARHNSTGWSDSSQVSSPDREGMYTVVDSGHGDSSVSTLEVSVTPHSHHHATLMPMQLYPVSQPMRVAFTASRTANYAPGNLDQPIVFDQLHSNLGEMYDPHMGRFTCPANGTYVFLFHILKLAINVPLYINLMRNEEVMVSAYANDGAPDHETASNHAILPLYQGDQVWLRLHRGAIYGSTWKYSTFSGFMLYQD